MGNTVFFVENHLKIDEKSSWEALGAPKLRKMVPRSHWAAHRGCPGVPRRTQRGKKGPQEAPKNAPWTPTGLHLGPSGAHFGGPKTFFPKVGKHASLGPGRSIPTSVVKKQCECFKNGLWNSQEVHLVDQNHSKPSKITEIHD